PPAIRKSICQSSKDSSVVCRVATVDVRTMRRHDFPVVIVNFEVSKLNKQNDYCQACREWDRSRQPGEKHANEARTNRSCRRRVPIPGNKTTSGATARPVRRLFERFPTFSDESPGF